MAHVWVPPSLASARETGIYGATEARTDKDSMTDTSSHTIDRLLERLRALLQEDDNVLFAFLFGLHAEGTARKESDLDIAVFY